MLVRIENKRKDTHEFSQSDMNILLKKAMNDIKDNDVININYECAYNSDGYYTHEHSITVFYKEPVVEEVKVKKEF